MAAHTTAFPLRVPPEHRWLAALPDINIGGAVPEAIAISKPPFSKNLNLSDP
jgi:hypothetical protein